MADNNTIIGWILAGGIAAVGLSIGAGRLLHVETPEEGKEGFAIEGAAEDGGGDTGPSLNTALANSDVAAGEKIFSQCSSCHTINQGGANGIGPNLFGVVGESIATGRGGFAFSPALKAVGGSWTFEQLDAWLQSPRKFADGTKMSFAGLGKIEDRANVIAYMNTQGSNLPLPAADAPEAEEGEDAEEAGAPADNPADDGDAPEKVTADAPAGGAEAKEQEASEVIAD